MKTSAMWWEKVLGNQSLLIDWLKKQYHGEVTAAVRIIGFRDAFALKEKHRKTLTIIASQEELHAAWVGELLTSRGIIPETLNKQERYWDSTLPGIEDFATGSAVASHAERMRLDRIRVIASHPNTPDDIRKVFEKILPQEIFHEKAFERMAGDQAMKKTLGHHQKGMEALGLVA